MAIGTWQSSENILLNNCEVNLIEQVKTPLRDSDIHRNIKNKKTLKQNPVGATLAVAQSEI
ncbi:MAG: hypothetical protein ABH808_00165 [Candidatus Kuenenbacteria bacterium]